MSRIGRGLIRLWHGVPLTGLGVAVLMVSVTMVLIVAIPQQDYALSTVALLGFTAIGLGLGLVLTASLLVHGAYRRATRRAPAAVVFEARAGFHHMLAFSGLRHLPLVELRSDWLRPGGMSTALERRGPELVERVVGTTRGLSSAVKRRFTIEDLFGLVRIEFERVEPREVQILPWTGALSRSPLWDTWVMGEGLSHPHGDLTGDRVEMRPYAAGDPLRLVLWKLYAKTGELIVRTPERAVDPGQRTVAFLVTGAGDEPCAGLARAALQSGVLGTDWVLGTDGPAGASWATEADEALRLICASASTAGQARGLDAFCSVHLKQGAGAVIFAPACGGPWVDRVADLAANSRAPIVVALAADQFRDDAVSEVGWWERPVAAAERGVEMLALEALGRKLAAAGASVLAFERPTGRRIVLATREHIA